MRRTMWHLLGGAAVLSLAAPGMAQQAEPAAAAETPPESGTREIVVTAQRRAESLQDVPVTITVFGAEQVQEARIQQVEDVVTRTVGLTFDAFPASQPRLAVRGIGSSDRGAAGDPSSAVFLDDIYLGRPAAIAFDAFDIERIEVLKGPQGTLFGRNVVGGAINVITRRPDITGASAAFEATYGNYERLEGAAFVNMPFAANTGAIRASAAYRSHDGFTRTSASTSRTRTRSPAACNSTASLPATCASCSRWMPRATAPPAPPTMCWTSTPAIPARRSTRSIATPRSPMVRRSATRTATRSACAPRSATTCRSRR